MKNKIREKKRAKRTIALSQIFILVVATIAFSWMIGSEVKVVSADEGLSCAIRGVTGICRAACTSDEATLGSVSADCLNCCTPTATSKEDCSDSQVGAHCAAACNANTEEPDTDYSYSGDCVAPLVFCCVPKTSNTDPPAEKSILDNQIVKTGTQLLETDLINKGINALVKAVTTTKVTPGTTLPTEIAQGTIKGIPSGPTSSGTAGKLANFFKSPFGSKFGHILKSSAWAAAAYIVINYFAKKYASARNAGDIAVVSGIGAVIGVLAVEVASGPPGWVAAVITIAITGIYMIFGYQVYSRELFTYRVGEWQPPTQAVGADCNKCNLLTVGTGNNKVNGCSEYICHSYGLVCDWVNNATKYETCIETHIGDKSAPVITPAKEIYGEDVFPNDKYDYVTSAAGSKIIYTGEGAGTGQCVPAFTPIELAIKTNEEAECKIIYNAVATGTTSAEKFDAMKDMDEGTAYVKNHTLELKSLVTASEASLNNAGYELTNGGVYKFFIRCKDVRANINSMDYQMSFCVQNGPDISPPTITKTNPTQNTYIPYYTINLTDSKLYTTINITNFQVFTNEPADCKWDTKKVNYNLMANNMIGCSQNVDQYLVGFDFGCITNLTGFKSGQENKYYVACMDQPELKGTDKESKRNKGDPYEVVLIGTNRLTISDIKINENGNGTTVRGSEDNMNVRLEVTTAGGADDGNARCAYSEDKLEPRSYSLFDNNDNRDFVTPNTQTLYMPTGTYTFFIKCYDAADNSNITMIHFSVEADKTAPVVVRVYRDEESNTLKLITDEKADCTYSNSDSLCSYAFADGTAIESTDGIVHDIEWDISKDFYIKCKDEFGNMPTTCSIIARPFEIFSVQ